jgi:hypothetical protein
MLLGFSANGYDACHYGTSHEDHKVALILLFLLVFVLFGCYKLFAKSHRPRASKICLILMFVALLMFFAWAIFGNPNCWS